MTAAELLRADLSIVASLVPHGARVLDLGCGDGALLEHLRNERRAVVRGVELSQAGIVGCLERGVPVIQLDLDEGLADTPDDSFDVVILSQTLQQVRRPELVLREMLRVGRRGIVSTPNFGYWRHRVHLLLRGTMPVSGVLPYQWYDTPNIHLATIEDLRRFIRAEGGSVVDEIALAARPAGGARRVGSWPNLLADTAVFAFERAAG